MTAEDNRERVRQWVEQVWNAGNVEALTRFHPQSFENQGERSTIEGAMRWHLNTRRTFPDIHYTIEDIFATGDRVGLRWTATGTHRGALWNMIPPTGKAIRWNGMHLLRLEGGQIVEVWSVQNTIAQLQQMGVRLQPDPEAEMDRPTAE